MVLYFIVVWRWSNLTTDSRVTSLTEGNENIVLVSVKQPWREFVIQPYEYNTNDTIAKKNVSIILACTVDLICMMVLKIEAETWPVGFERTNVMDMSNGAHHDMAIMAWWSRKLLSYRHNININFPSLV